MKDWFSISVEDFYNQESGNYEIPSEYLTKGCKKNITQCISNFVKAEQDIIRQTALTRQGNLKYVENMWSDDNAIKIAIDPVVELMLNHCRYLVTGKSKDFIDNITGQCWISYKQFNVLSSMVNAKHTAPSWENDFDEELSKDYLGISK